MPIDETGEFSIPKLIDAATPKLSDCGMQAERFALPEPDDEVIVASTGDTPGEGSIWLDLGARMLGSPEEGTAMLGSPEERTPALGSPEERAPMLGSPEERTGESHHYSFRWWYDYSSDNSVGSIGIAGAENHVAFHDTDFV
jgi:hypothetical protein